MWLLFAVLSLLAYALFDIWGKRSVDLGNAYTPFEMIILVGTLCFPISIVLYVLGVNESGLAPWVLIWKHPIILISLGFFMMYWMFCLFAFRYVGLFIEEAFNSLSGIVLFFGIILLNNLTGKLPSATEMLHPLRLFPIMLILISVALLPNIEVFTDNHIKVARAQRKRMIIGMLLLIIAVLSDSATAITTAVIFDEGNIGIVDYLVANYFAAIIPVCIFSIFLLMKDKKWYVPFKRGNRYRYLYPIATILAAMMYCFASSFDAVRTSIVFIIYPILPMIGAKVLLNEKYTWKQNLCIWTIVVSSITFCISDYFLE